MFPVIAMDEPRGRPQDRPRSRDRPPRDPQGSGGFDETPLLIRIGPKKHNYMYYRVNVWPSLYRCYRASDWSGSNGKLWLFRDSSSGSLP